MSSSSSRASDAHRDSAPAGARDTKVTCGVVESRSCLLQPSDRHGACNHIESPALHGLVEELELTANDLGRLRELLEESRGPLEPQVCHFDVTTYVCLDGPGARFAREDPARRARAFGLALVEKRDGELEPKAHVTVIPGRGETCRGRPSKGPEGYVVPNVVVALLTIAENRGIRHIEVSATKWLRLVTSRRRSVDGEMDEGPGVEP